MKGLKMTKCNCKRFTLTFAITVLISIYTANLQQVEAYYSDASHYDPEGQDGIPILSARGIPLSSSSGWNDEVVAPAEAQRRNSDADLDDAAEDDDDEDRDEYKSGSSNHDTYENPSFGESQRAARDGDDIESFFDKHIGPDDAMDSPADEGEVPISNIAQRRGDFDDHYEAAASSPLSNIFHSLLNHAHKNKIIITTTDDGQNPASGSEQDNQQQTASSSSNPAAASAAATAAAYQIGAAPIAYYTPIAASSSMAAYGNQDQGQDGSQEDDSTGVREIYISRRPSGASYSSSYVPQQAYAYAPMSGQSSNANWRGYPGQGHRPAYQVGGGADYGAGVPVAASYAYNNREQPAAAAAVAPEDDQTVSYGLSFGGSGDDDSSNESSGGAGASNADEQSGADEPEAYSPQMMRHSSSKAYNNYQYVPVAIPPQAYARQQYVQQQQQQRYYVPQQQYAQADPQQGGAVRYHRDPSESTAQMVGYHQQQQQQQQYSPISSRQQQQAGSQNAVSLARQNEWVTRQSLLANLDRQIKSNPNYSSSQSAAATTPSSAYLRKSPTSGAGLNQFMSTNQPNHRKRLQQEQSPVRQSNSANDYDTYNSIHAEVDPFRSLTTVSQTISEPVGNNNHLKQLGLTARGPQYSNNPIFNKNNENNGNDSTPMSSRNNSVAEHQVDSNNDNSSGMVNLQSIEGESNNSPSRAPSSADMKTNNPNINHNNKNTLTGPVTKIGNDELMHKIVGDSNDHVNLRVRRDDSDDRESDDADDDGVWVDDDEDDTDNSKQSSDLNETAQDPEEDDNGAEEDQQDNAYVMVTPMNPPGVIGGPHGYELSPNDLMIYQG